MTDGSDRPQDGTVAGDGTLVPQTADGSDVGTPGRASRRPRRPRRPPRRTVAEHGRGADPAVHAGVAAARGWSPTTRVTAAEYQAATAAWLQGGISGGTGDAA